MKKEAVLIIALFLLPTVFSVREQYYTYTPPAPEPPTCKKTAIPTPYDPTIMDFQCLSPTSDYCLIQTPQQAVTGLCTKDCTCIRRELNTFDVEILCNNKKPMIRWQPIITEKTSREKELPPQPVTVTIALHQQNPDGTTSIQSIEQRTQTNSKTPLVFDLEIQKNAIALSQTCDGCENAIEEEPISQALKLFRDGVLKNVAAFNRLTNLNATPTVVWNDTTCNYGPKNATITPPQPALCGDTIMQRGPPFLEECEQDKNKNWKHSMCRNKRTRLPMMCHTCKCICKPCKKPLERLDPISCMCNCQPGTLRNKQKGTCETIQ